MRVISIQETLIIGSLCLVSWLFSSSLRDSSCPPDWNFGSDTTTYTNLAANMLAGKGYVLGPDTPYYGSAVTGDASTYFHCMHILPGYPLLLVLCDQLVGQAHGPYLLAFLLFVIMSLCVYGAGKVLFGGILSSRVLWTTFIIFQIFQPILILQLQAIGRDLAATAFTAAFVFALVLLFKTDRPGWLLAVFLGITTMASVLIRTNNFALMLPVLAVGSLFFWHKRQPRKTCIVAGATLLTVACLILWGLYLKKYVGRFMLGTDQGSSLYSNFVYRSQGPKSFERDTPQITAHFNERLAHGVSIEQALAESGQEYQNIAIQFLRENPGKLPRLVLFHVAVVFFDKDYFWMPRLLYVKWSGAPMKDYDYNFKKIFHDQTSLLPRGVYWTAHWGSYFIYIVFPMLCLLAVPLAYMRRKLSPSQNKQDPDYLFPLALLSSSAILFLLATSVLGMAMARYRMPVSAISYCCILCLMALWRKPRTTRPSER